MYGAGKQILLRCSGSFENNSSLPNCNWFCSKKTVICKGENTDCIMLAIFMLSMFQTFNKAHFSLVWHAAAVANGYDNDNSNDYNAFVHLYTCMCICCMYLLLANLRGCFFAVTNKVKLYCRIGIYIKSGSMEDIAMAAECRQTSSPFPHCVD